MKVLVVGGGGREHALVWKLAKSPKVADIYCAPGNGGIKDLAQCVDIKATDIEKMTVFAQNENIDLVIVTPDDPLVLGMVDALEKKGIRAFGPSKRAAVIEGSKVFSKNFMKKHNIPTANFEVFDDRELALEYLRTCKYPTVVKADGLALGKGVFIAKDLKEAKDAVDACMVDKVFGRSGNRVVIEEFIEGPEISVLCFTDGETIVPMPSAQDHKRIYDGGKGPNTGGMGAFSPSPHYTEDMARYCMDNIFKPTMNAMNEEGRKFKGILYFGLMLTDSGIKVLEYNARFGDPETQVILPLLKTDIVDILEAIIDERLEGINIEWKENICALTVVLASGGYPGAFNRGYHIQGLDEIDKIKDLTVFHAGTKSGENVYYTDGGRVLNIVSTGKNIKEARDNIYKNIDKIQFKDMFYRKDIGKK
ncbi:MAG: phosphoribosylamine--glycine ligase [Clostridiales bacterium]|nr:phosphoribosylamine--glycine ligase [Clostridiales bacterium]